jgi:hypothetical protein
MPHRRIASTEIREDMSPLVRELAGHYWQLVVLRAAPLGLIDLCQRARALLEPIEDYETPARAAGWLPDPGDTLGRVFFDTTKRNGHDESFYLAESWEAACERMNLEPAAREVREVWSVSEWLADRLGEMGERTGELCGLTLWARTGTEPLQTDETIKAIWRLTDTATERTKL